MSTIRYIKNFIKDPAVASITPTSRFSVAKVCKNIDFSKDIRIIEFGPADGVFTKFFLEKMTPGSEIIAIEKNKDFAAILSSIMDKRLFVKNCSAEHISEIADSMKWEHADYVVSGIPFSFINKDTKHGILKSTADILTDNGLFLVYQTSNHLKPYLKKYFREVSVEMELLNIPPVCIMKAQK